MAASRLKSAAMQSSGIARAYTALCQLLNTIFQQAFRLAMIAVETDWVPDAVIRVGIRALLAKRLAEEGARDQEAYVERIQGFVDELKGMPVAIQTQAANEQHYEVPTEYFLLCLGRHLKYSSCFYPRLDPATPLSEAEEAMLEMTCQRARLGEAQHILELGCGWGSLSLYMAAKYPGSQVTAVSNSKTQATHIRTQAQQRGLSNLTAVTADVVTYQAQPKAFDRVVSVEMFEHMKNYKELLRRIATWLRPQGLLFVHIFCHKRFAYHFEDKGEDDWMTRFFFSGGTMPSAELLFHFQDDMALQRYWYINGRHYSLTLEAWLARMDQHRKQIMPIMQSTYGAHQALKWWVYWRLFYLACSELFRYNGGNEWGVGHYLFCPAGQPLGRTPAAAASSSPAASNGHGNGHRNGH